MAKVLIHVGEGETRETYEFPGLGKMPIFEVIEMEQVTGIRGKKELHQAMADDSAAVIAALVWIFRKRTNPYVQFEDVTRSLSIDEVSTEIVEDVEPAAPKDSTAKKAGKKATASATSDGGRSSPTS